MTIERANEIKREIKKLRNAVRLEGKFIDSMGYSEALEIVDAVHPNTDSDRNVSADADKILKEFENCKNREPDYAMALYKSALVVLSAFSIQRELTKPRSTVPPKIEADANELLAGINFDECDDTQFKRK